MEGRSNGARFLRSSPSPSHCLMVHLEERGGKGGGEVGKGARRVWGRRV